MTIATLFLIVALVLFILAALPKIEIGRINLVPLGLAFVVGAMLVGRLNLAT